MARHAVTRDVVDGKRKEDSAELRRGMTCPLRTHITGFGAFGGVPTNPTVALIERLEREQPSIAGVEIASTEILEVSIDGVLTSLAAAPASTASDVWVHLGVDGGAAVVKLERCAYNDASFRIPDECGAQPWRETICASDRIDRCLECPLDLAAAAAEVDHGGDDGDGDCASRRVALSSDAGRFLCNYVYYLSQRRCLAGGGAALFVHVPPCATLSEDDAYALLLELLGALGRAGAVWRAAGDAARPELAQRQLWELEAIESMFADGLVEVDAASRAAAQRVAEDESALAAAAGDASAAAASTLLRFTVTQHDARSATRCSCELPPLYPARAAARVALLPGGDLTPSALRMVNDALAEEAASRVGDEALLQLLQRAAELVREIVDADGAVDAADDAAAQARAESLATDRALALAVQQQQQEAAEEDQQQRHPPLPAAAPLLGRRCIYFHHVIARSKRKAVMEWAVECGLGGFAKIGWPGVVVVEGEEEACAAYVSSLQRLRWKQMVVRGEQQVEGRAGQSLDELRALPRGMQEFPDDGMSAMALACKRCGVHELFLTAMQIYCTKKS